ncbi:MAG: hypothetical protein BroJett042_32500 [Bacteroidota bacterium]|nr:MAG: hypothetical protein UZ12_BCD005002139 [Bacteroidetes bacterium OLB12]GIL24737.1 MAG: hypothetical protein BroJett042_32500 [Bacteroidota bacterium]HNR73882.1 hypothetical protein [Cyclobacteriaceae bacterium]
MHHRCIFTKLVALGTIILASGCATYYQANQSFNQDFERGNLESALATLQANTKEAKSKREFLYYVNNGLVLSMMSRYKESNAYLEKAFLFGEDYRMNYLNEAASYLTNPNVTTYRGEDHEHLMLLYYKAINYLKLGDTQAALVECRRLNIRLQQLSDRYKNENKFQRDAFIHTLMGLIYETDKDYNNAFIAYRNAATIYEEDYSRLFNISVPEQLKKDLVRMAWLNGFTSEYEFYKSKWNMPEGDFEMPPANQAEVIFFWHNGLAPVKAEWGINFLVDRRDNWVYFYNRELGINFPFSLEGYDQKEKDGLARLEVFRVAFPRYMERPLYFQEASIITNGAEQPLALLEDVNKIAFKSLQQRMHLELSKALIRVALKKVTEYQVKQEDKTLGSVLGVINAITEKADTRNWQTLPHSIYYTRVAVPAGQSKLTLTLKDGNRSTTHDFSYTLNKGQILFHTFTSLESRYPNYGFFDSDSYRD